MSPLGLHSASSRRSRLWRNLLALTGGQLASKLFGFLAFAYLARRLSPLGYGAVEYAAGLAFIAGMFVDAGLSPVGVRRIARDAQRVDAVSAEILSARCLLSIAAAALLGASALALAPDPLTQRLILVFSVSLLAAPWSQLWLFQAVDRIAWTAGIQSVRMGVFLAAVLLLVRGPQDVLWAGVAEFAGLSLAGTSALALQRRFVAPVYLRFRFDRLRRLLREALPIAIANLVAVLTLFAPLLLAVNLEGAAASAYFAGAHRLFFALVTLSWIYHFNLFPVMARSRKTDQVELRRIVEASIRIVAWGGSAVALGLTLMAEPLLAMLFGSSFAAAATAFALLVWALPVKLLADHAGWLLIADGGERAVLSVRLVGLILAFAGGIPMVSVYGPLGGAGALLGAAVSMWIGFHLAIRRRLGWMPWTPAIPALACALLPWLVLHALSLHPLTEAAIAGLLLFLLASLFRRQLLADYRVLAAVAPARSVAPAALDLDVSAQR